MSECCIVRLGNRKGYIFKSFYIYGNREEVKTIILNAKYQRYLIINQSKTDLMISNSLLEDSVIEIEEIIQEQGE